jgi:hypothetical protein
MGKINVARVILGGLLGLIINISELILNLYVVADESNAIMQRLACRRSARIRSPCSWR